MAYDLNKFRGWKHHPTRKAVPERPTSPYDLAAVAQTTKLFIEKEKPLRFGGIYDPSNAPTKKKRAA